MIKRQFTMTFTAEMHEDFPTGNIDLLVQGYLLDLFMNVKITEFKEDACDHDEGCEV